MTVKASIERKLTTELFPESLTVVDESHLHAGHSGHRAGGETHFRVTITSAAFAGQSRIDRHRIVNRVLADELAGPVHALAIHATAPDEALR